MVGLVYYADAIESLLALDILWFQKYDKSHEKFLCFKETMIRSKVLETLRGK